jgi:hypothetical protein
VIEEDLVVFEAPKVPKQPPQRKPPAPPPAVQGPAPVPRVFIAQWLQASRQNTAVKRRVKRSNTVRRPPRPAIKGPPPRPDIFLRFFCTSQTKAYPELLAPRLNVQLID